MLRSILWLLPLLALVGCGDLPEPFLGNPGATGRILAQPPTPRLAVPPPGNALLPDAGEPDPGRRPRPGAAGAGGPRRRRRCRAHRLAPGRHRLDSAARPWCRSSPCVDPQGKDRGKTEGAAVPAADLGRRHPGDPAPVRRRRRPENRRPAHRHRDRAGDGRPQQPVQPPRQGHGRRRHRRPRRRRRRR